MAVPSSHNIFVRFESNIKDCSLNPNVLSELYEMWTNRFSITESGNYIQNNTVKWQESNLEDE